MTSAEYFKKLLPYYKSMYDMEQPYTLCGIDCLAHGHFYSHSEKYVLSREAKLWESNNFEHVFFLERDVLRESDLQKLDTIIREYAEPELVREGNTYPDKNHMYTYLTFVFLCNSSPDREVKKSLKKYHFTRNYLFTFRGWCEVRLVAVDLFSGEILTNRTGASLSKLYKKLLKKETCSSVK